MKSVHNIFLQAFSVIMATILLGACSRDFLDVHPKGRLIAENTNDYELLLNSGSNTILYPQFVMGDEMAAVEPYFTAQMVPFDQKGFRWDNDIYLPNETQTEWTILMGRIYKYNKIINEVMASSGGSDAKKQAVRSEALANRAWCYFMLTSLYGKPFHAATAASDLAVPLVTEANVTQTEFTRATVKAAYDFIIKDLTDAIPHLPAISNRIRMSKPAAEGLLGKIYLFAARPEQALPLLESAISGLSGAAIPVGFYNFNTELAPGGKFTPVSPITGPARPILNDDMDVVYLTSTFNLYAYVYSSLVMTPATVALFTPGDLRLKQFTSDKPFGEFVKVFPHGMRRAWGRAGLTNQGVSFADLWLLRAECKARLNDLAGAKADIEALRLKRMPAAEAPVPAAIAGNGEALVKYVLDERLREFAMEGYRWFDMRRLSADPVFNTTVGKTHIAYDMSGTVTGTYTLRPERFTLRIPPNIADFNPGMPQNP